MTLGKLKCKLGFHKWKYYRYANSDDVVRICQRCGRIEIMMYDMVSWSWGIPRYNINEYLLEEITE